MPRLNSAEFPDSAAGRSDSFDRFDHRYKEGLDLIVRGAMSVR
jgi:hypothetical protein